MSLYMAVPALLGVAVLGWVAGMWTFKRSLCWCRSCGLTLRCPQCAATKATTHPVAR
jgi:hypothetical protein